MLQWQGTLGRKIQECIQDCVDCHATCLQTLSHCLERGGRHAEPRHIRLLSGCAALCHAAGELMALGTELQRSACSVCAEACDRCADACEALASDDLLMKACAETCRRCARSCRGMAGDGGRMAA